MPAENTTEDDSDDENLKLAVEMSLMESFIANGSDDISTLRNDTIEISEDEFDSMCSDNNSSALSLKERLTNNPTRDTSIVILSDTSPELKGPGPEEDSKVKMNFNDRLIININSDDEKSPLNAVGVQKSVRSSKTALEEKINRKTTLEPSQSCCKLLLRKKS